MRLNEPTRVNALAKGWMLACRRLVCQGVSMESLLPRDCTLRSLAHQMSAPVEFVRAVFANMAGYQQDCQARLALNCKAARPDYQIEFLIYDEIDGEEVIIPQTAAVFIGSKHIEPTYDDATLDRPWSSHAMTWLEVRQLLGELRGLIQAS